MKPYLLSGVIVGLLQSPVSENSRKPRRSKSTPAALSTPPATKAPIPALAPPDMMPRIGSAALTRTQLSEQRLVQVATAARVLSPVLHEQQPFLYQEHRAHLANSTKL